MEMKNQKEKIVNRIQSKRQELIHSKKMKNNVLILFLIVFIIGNLFFVTSKGFFSGVSRYGVTPLNETQILENYFSFTIRRWEYSEDEGKMELEIDVDPQTTDGLKDYSFEVATLPVSQKAEVNVLVYEPTYAVVQITNIPKRFKAVSFRACVEDNGADNTLLKMYTNSEAVERVDSLPAKTKVEYYKMRLVRNIKEYEEDMTNLSVNINECYAKIDDLKNKNETLEREKQYLTLDGIQQNNILIENNLKQISDVEKQINEKEDEMQEFNHKKNEAETTLTEIE